METLTTSRLLVRSFEEPDLSDYLAFHTHPDVARTMGKPPMDAAKVASYLAERAAARGDERGKWQGYAVVCREDDRTIGEVGLYLHAEPDDEGDLGFAFHPDYQGRGLATEAAGALVQHGFMTLGLRRITAHCDAGNAASSRLIERLGMRRQASEGDGLAYVLTREEWLARTGTP